MSTRFAVLVFMAAFLLTGALGVMAQDEAKDEKPQYTYTGVKVCKMCHNKEATGKQYSVWMEGPHAKAFETLGSDKAKAKAKELGLGNPQEEAKCLKCHVTAFPVMADLENQKITMEEGVSCESCHGPGSGYKSKKVMEAVYAGDTEAASVGLIKPDAKVCENCHNDENPFHKEFKFEEFAKKIAHAIPEAK